MIKEEDLMISCLPFLNELIAGSTPSRVDIMSLSSYWFYVHWGVNKGICKYDGFLHTSHYIKPN